MTNDELRDERQKLLEDLLAAADREIALEAERDQLRADNAAMAKRLEEAEAKIAQLDPTCVWEPFTTGRLNVLCKKCRWPRDGGPFRHIDAPASSPTTEAVPHEFLCRFASSHPAGCSKSCLCEHCDQMQWQCTGGNPEPAASSLGHRFKCGKNKDGEDCGTPTCSCEGCGRPRNAHESKETP